MPQIPANHMQAFVLGMLNGQFMKWQAEYENGQGMIKITNVVPEVDDEGNYLNVINVTLESGIVLQVRVDELVEIHEEP